ncbi:MAG: biopolymer transporter ExbD [Elusimicrobia bacterium]|nr:biopolymer transporter ExbD [Candidatus Liberimonas magnetica]
MDEKEFDVINVIPFIDIMLVLLTIVLTTSTFIASGSIPLALPKATINKTELLKTHIIEIDKQGNLYVNTRPVYVEDLCNGLCKLERKAPLLIRADRDIPLQIFVDVMDTLKTHGFSNIALQTEKKT